MTGPALSAAAAVVLLLAGVVSARAAADGPAPGAPAPGDRPVVVPQHDVDVAYAVPLPSADGSAAATLVQRMRFSAATLRQRIDPPGGALYMITDYRSRRLIVVRPTQRSAVLLPAPGEPIAPHGVPAAGAFRRLGTETVAGSACTEWSTRDVSGQNSVVCFTDDGVLLRARQQDRVLLQATRIDRSPQPAEVFEVPAGDRLQRPDGSPPP